MRVEAGSVGYSILNRHPGPPTGLVTGSARAIEHCR